MAVRTIETPAKPEEKSITEKVNSFYESARRLERLSYGNTKEASNTDKDSRTRETEVRRTGT